MGGVVKGIGKAVGGGLKKLGGVASKVAPIVGLVPGVGPLAAGALGLGGGLLSGKGIGGSLKAGLGGALGGLAGGGLQKLLGGGGALSKIGGLLGGKSAGGGSDAQQFMQSLLDKQGGGGGGIKDLISKFLSSGGLQKLGGLGLGASSIIGANKARGEHQRAQQAGLDLQTGALGQAEDIFNSKARLRTESLAKLGGALNRPTSPGLFRPRQ